MAPSSSREEPRTTTGGTAAKAPPVAMDAKLLVAECPEDRKLLKELVHKEDASKMMVVLASNTNQPAEKPAAARAVMNPLLLAAACFGSPQVLNLIFSREDAREPQLTMPTRELYAMLSGDTSGDGRRSSREVEDGGAIIGESTRGLPDAPLLEGVTVAGDTALHVVATHGDTANFVACAEIICNRDKNLLSATSNKGDTPLHCAARAGRLEMASRLIALAKAGDNDERGQASFSKVFLRTENERDETALHDAVRTGDGDMVRRLMNEDPDLALFPVKGTSPLYLAISLRNDTIAEILHQKSNGNISYSGPHGQNALHATVHQDNVVMTEQVLKWNNKLVKEGDENGSTPVHFAASLLRPKYQKYRTYHRRRPWIRVSRVPRIISSLLDADTGVDPFYQSDKNGMFPIHVAASVGVQITVAFLLHKFPDSTGLRDANGRTFLHVAVEKKKLDVVQFACRTPSLNWILNMQDKDGNTALHLAIQGQAKQLLIFCALFGNREVHLNLTNHNGHTPLDQSRSMLPRGLSYTVNTKLMIYRALEQAGSLHRQDRWDHIQEIYDRSVVSPEDQAKESEKVKDLTQTLGIGSVLIATVTFGAMFAPPGGYRADDHPYGGTPILAGSYIFDAFMMANTLAFICSSIATTGLIYSGSSVFNLGTRGYNFIIIAFLMDNSVTCLTTAFALGAYMVLPPVDHKTAVAICVLSPLVVIYRNMYFWIKNACIAKSQGSRMGLLWLLPRVGLMFLCNLLSQFWSFIVMFSWVAYRRNKPQPQHH